MGRAGFNEAKLLSKDNIEVWKFIPGYKGLYEVSNLGRVKSLEKLSWNGVSHFKKKEKILKPQKYDKYGHLLVNLCKDGKPKSIAIHILVLLAFHSKCPKGYECRHLDGKPANNCLYNLKWGTRKENAEDMAKHGSVKGKKHGMVKLRKKDVNNIIKLLKEGILSQIEIGKKYGISRRTVYQIKSGKHWAIN